MDAAENIASVADGKAGVFFLYLYKIHLMWRLFSLLKESPTALRANVITLQVNVICRMQG